MRSYSHIGLNPKPPINSQTHGTDHISIYSDIAANMFLSYHGHDVVELVMVLVVSVMLVMIT